MNIQEAWARASAMHLLILGMVARLPASSEPFPKAKRDQWLEAMRLNLEVIYGDGDEPLLRPDGEPGPGGPGGEEAGGGERGVQARGHDSDL